MVDAFAGTSAETDDNWIEFFTENLCVIANVIDNAARLRIRVYLPRDDEDLVTDWVAQQPKPTSGLLQAAYINEGQCRPRLVFERPTGDHDWLTDPMLGEVGRYLAAWLDDRTTDRASGSLARFTIPDDPRDVAPANAWLLKGTEASSPTREALEDDRAAANVGIFTREWTTAAQTQIGDLALFYFLNPRKAVHLVARAASNAYFSNNIPVVADGAVNSAQWWAYFTTPIEIEPITVGQLRSAVGGYLPLRGRSGLYLRPETIEALSFRAVDPMQQAELDWW